MTCRRLLLSYVRSMAIGATACLLILLKLFLDSYDLRIRRLLVVFVTSSAGRNRHVRRQSSYRAGARDVDVASRALQHVFALAAFVTELCRESFARINRCECGGRLVATGAVIIRGFLILPMTIEAGIVSVWRCLESAGPRLENFGAAWGWLINESVVGHVTDRTVVVVRLLVVRRSEESGPQECYAVV